MPLFLVRVVLMFLLQLVICEVGFLTGLKMRSHFPQKLVVAVLAVLAGVAVLNWLRVALPGDGYVPFKGNRLFRRPHSSQCRGGMALF